MRKVGGKPRIGLTALGTVGHWGVEGAWSYGRSLAQYLVAAGQTVYEVSPRWTALQRRSARRPGKTDWLDAHAVALFVRQEAPDLPVIGLDDASAVLELLTTEREAAVRESSRLRTDSRPADAARSGVRGASARPHGS